VNPHPDIELTIDELNLIGFDPRARADIGDHTLAALQELVAKHLDAHGSVTSFALPHLAIGQIPSGASRKSIGTAIAQRIYTAIVDAHTEITSGNQEK